MRTNLRKFNEDQLWNLYGQKIESAAEIRKELKRRLSEPRLKVVRKGRVNNSF